MFNKVIEMAETIILKQAPEIFIIYDKAHPLNDKLKQLEDKIYKIYNDQLLDTFCSLGITKINIHLSSTPNLRPGLNLYYDQFLSGRKNNYFYLMIMHIKNYQNEYAQPNVSLIQLMENIPINAFLFGNELKVHFLPKEN